MTFTLEDLFDDMKDITPTQEHVFTIIWMFYLDLAWLPPNAEPDLSLCTCSFFRTVIPRKQTGIWEDWNREREETKAGEQLSWLMLWTTGAQFCWGLSGELCWMHSGIFHLRGENERLHHWLPPPIHEERVDTGDVHVHLPGLHMHQNGWVSPQLCPTRSWKNYADTENQSYMVQQRQGAVQTYLRAAVCYILN